MAGRENAERSSATWDFGAYLRTGRLVPTRRPIELKFNPYHDPKDGRFTFKSGGNTSSRGSADRSPGSVRRSSTSVSPDLLSPETLADIHRGAAIEGTASPETRASPDDRELGSLSARYESRGNPGTVSSGRNDPGGVSYGIYQLATRTGDADAFVASPEFAPWAAEFQNLTPGTPAFGNQWRAVAARDPDAFREAQHDYIQRTHYDPTADRVERGTGYDLNNASDAVRNVTWSVSVQHGNAARILSDAVRRTDQTLRRDDSNYETRLIDNIYARRTEYVAAVRDSTRNRGQAEQLNEVIHGRYPRERLDAQNMLSRQRQR